MANPVLPSRAHSAIDAAVDRLFERMKLRFLGPGFGSRKEVRIGYRPDLTLSGVYERAAAEERTKGDPAIAKSLNRVTESYLDAQKELTKAKVRQSVTAWLADAARSGTKTDLETVLGGELATVWGQVQRAVIKIVDSESTRARNLGTVEGISKVSSASGIEDPTVFFITVRDSERCEECTKIHLLPDGTTPRVWKMSEVSSAYHKRGEDFPSIGGLHPHCFVGSTRLHTDLGLLTARELFEVGGVRAVVVDNRVRCYRNDEGLETAGKTWLDRHKFGAHLRSATNVYSTGDRRCLRVSLDNGLDLEVSEEHEFWIDDDNMGIKKAASSLAVGDKVPLLSGEGQWGGDHFPEVAELMGNLLGDGHLGKKTASWHFFGDDIPYGHKLKSFALGIVSSMGLNAFLARKMTENAPNKKYKVKYASFNSKSLKRSFIEDFGLSKKPRRVPARIWGATKETVSAFLRGLYSADGHSERTPSVVLAQNDLEFLKEIQILLANFGLVSRVFRHGTGRKKEIAYADGRTFETKRKPCWRLHIGGWGQVDRFSKEIGFGPPRKQKQLEDRLQESRSKTRLGSWRTAKVVAVQDIGIHPTFCLTEPMTNTVSANGVVVGQCRCSLSSLSPGFGFSDSGRIKYVGLDHDEFAKQRGGQS